MLSAPYLESCTAQYIRLRLWGKTQSFPENDIFTSPFCFPVWGKAWVTMPKVVAADHLRGGQEVSAALYSPYQRMHSFCSRRYYFGTVCNSEILHSFAI